MKLIKGEQGQVFILFALMFPIFCGLLGLATDVGWIFYNQSKLQNASDFAVLAGGQDIPTNYYKEDVTKTSFNCHSHNADNPTSTNDKETALKYFCKNYPSDNVTSIWLGKAIKIPGQDFFGLKAKVVDDIQLLFMPLLGIDTATIHAQSYVVVEKLARPNNVIPIAFDHTDMLDVLNGQPQTNLIGTSCPHPDLTKTPREILIWAEDSDSHKGNFGILDLTSNLTGPELAYQIEHGLPEPVKYPTFIPPLVGEKIDTKTGSMAKHIKQGFENRMANGFTDAYLPIVDISKASGASSKLEVLGYVNLTNIRPDVLELSAPPRTVACIYADYEKQVLPADAGYFDMKTAYYGAKRVVLTDENAYVEK